MDKREALGIYLKVHNECRGHKDCLNCPFIEYYKGIKVCVLSHPDDKEIVKTVEDKLKRISEAPEQKTLDQTEKVKATTTLYAKAPISAKEFEKQLKALLPNRLTLEPLPKEDRPIKMPDSNKPDNVNHPKHYLKGGLECIQVIEAQLTPQQYEGYLYGNVLKYMWRWPDKNGLEDLRKAKHYLDWLIDEVEKNGGNRKEVKN